MLKMTNQKQRAPHIEEDKRAHRRSEVDEKVLRCVDY
jgi:hypothetical protein